jgi:hypothetical protein
MTYFSLTYSLTEAADHYVNHNLVQSNETTFLKKQILARGARFVLTPASFISSALDTIIGLGAGIGAILTLGTHASTFKVAINHLSNSKMLVALPYVNILLTINPEAKVAENSTNKYKPPMIRADKDGLISDIVINSLRNVARTCYNSDNFLKRHVATRLTYVLLAVSCLVTRVVDGIIGIPAAGLSILTGGKYESLNNLAYRTLQTPGIIYDLFYCTIKLINPWN